MVLYYADGGSFNNWMKFSDNWYNDMFTLEFIIQGLGKIHEKNMVHRDFHIGNIVIQLIHHPCISDMGLCGYRCNKYLWSYALCSS